MSGVRIPYFMSFVVRRHLIGLHKAGSLFSERTSTIAFDH